MSEFSSKIIVPTFWSTKFLLRLSAYVIKRVPLEATTEAGFKRNSFIYEFMSSMRQKINDPLGKRVDNQKTISQR